MTAVSSPYSRIALVGGASEGIGWQCADLLARAGFRVVAFARTEDRLLQAVAKLSCSELNHIGMACDSSQAESVAQMLAQLDALGTVSVVVNNSGGPSPGPVAAAKSEQFQTALQQHVLAAQQISQVVLPGMKRQKYGRWVNIISTSVKEPLKDLGVSNTIRAAMGAWAKTLAGEVAGFGITVNNVLPGFTKTARLEAIIRSRQEKTGASLADIEQDLLREVPAGRFADAIEVASAVAFLCSESAGYITGINLPVDGGRTRSL